MFAPKATIQMQISYGNNSPKKKTNRSFHLNKELSALKWAVIIGFDRFAISFATIVSIQQSLFFIYLYIQFWLRAILSLRAFTRNLQLYKICIEAKQTSDTTCIIEKKIRTKKNRTKRKSKSLEALYVLLCVYLYISSSFFFLYRLFAVSAFYSSFVGAKTINERRTANGTFNKEERVEENRRFSLFIVLNIILRFIFFFFISFDLILMW